jgi:hypothetical protein
MINHHIAHRRLANQFLLGRKADSPEEVVRHLCAVQAQDYAAAKWAIGQRVAGVVDGHIDQLLNSGTILRTHVLRPTWHFVMPEDIRWLLDLTAPRVKAAMAHGNRHLDLDEGLLLSSNDLLANALRDAKHLTRVELAQALTDGGVAASGQRLAYILMRAEIDAVICSGGLRGKQFTYALLDERVPRRKPLPKDEALSMLSVRYFRGHGPATAHDFAWWSGLTVTDARRGIALAGAALAHETIEGTTYWSSASEARPTEIAPPILLLPHYDEYLVGYKGYGALFNGRHLAPNALSSLLTHAIILNGQVVGAWSRTPRKSEVVVVANLLVEVDEEERRALGLAAEAYGRFLGLRAVVEFG